MFNKLIIILIFSNIYVELAARNDSLSSFLPHHVMQTLSQSGKAQCSVIASFLLRNWWFLPWVKRCYVVSGKVKKPICVLYNFFILCNLVITSNAIKDSFDRELECMLLLHESSRIETNTVILWQVGRSVFMCSKIFHIP
jgi:hypothetical protein